MQENAAKTSVLMTAVSTVLCLLMCRPAVGGEPTVPMSKQEAEQWLQWVCPLPKQISIRAKRQLPVSSIAVRVTGKAGPLERLAAEQLRGLLQHKMKQPATGDFEIVLGVCDEQGLVEGAAVSGAAGLAKLPNNEQAYVIAPLESGGMALTGLDPRGVSYAAKTFGQLLKPTIADGRVDVPLANVVDWPDLAERGLWGWYENRMDHMDVQEIDWFAGLKLNHLEILAKLHAERGKPAVATIDTQMAERCRQRAIKMVPAVVHTDYLGGPRGPGWGGILEDYPEARAKGELVLPSHPLVCLSQPVAQRVYDGWLTSLARTVESDDVMVWFSEFTTASCGCDQCKGKDRFEQELQVFLHALGEARKVRPGLRLRVLLTQASLPRNMQIIKAAPPDVGFTHYGPTYTLARRPMIYPELREAALRDAAKGRRFGCYPTLCGCVSYCVPFVGAAYMQERLGEFRQFGVNLTGYVPDSLRAYDNEFTLSAAAEYAWNSAGRTPREFVVSWATRHRLPDPEKVAQWWQLVEEPQRNLCNSDMVPPGPSAVSGYWFSLPGKLVARQPVLMAGFSTPKELEENLDSLHRALALAEFMQNAYFVEATRYTLSMLEAGKAVHDLSLRLAGRAALTDADKRDAAALLERAYSDVGRAIQAITAWGNLAQYSVGDNRNTTGMVASLRKACGLIEESAKKLGLDAVFKPKKGG